MGHGEIQETRFDPRLLSWNDFVDRVASYAYPHVSSGTFYGPLVDCSAVPFGTGRDIDGGNVSYIASPNLNLNLTQDQDAAVPNGTVGTIASGNYKHVYVGDGSTATWTVTDGASISCGSFYLGRGGVLAIVGPSHAAVSINVQRILQIDGAILASGSSDGKSKPLELTLQTGCSDFPRVPSIVSRGGNGGSGGDAGAIVFRGDEQRHLSVTQDQVDVLDGGQYSARPLYRYYDETGAEIVRASAIGGSGGPRGGDSASGAPGVNGTKGKDNGITVLSGIAVPSPSRSVLFAKLIGKKRRVQLV
jgi:hypothetical protein